MPSLYELDYSPYFYLQGSNGSVVFTGLKKGRYILKIFARNKLLDVAALKMVIVV